MNDGTTLVGTIEKQEPGQYVIILLPDGTQQTINWEQIKVVNVAPRAGQSATSNPSDQKQLTANVMSSSGEAVTFTLAPPPTYVINFAMGGFASYASQDGLYLVGAGTDLSVQTLFGVTPFPDRHGGNWGTVRADGYLQLQGGGLIVDGNSSTDGGYVALNAGLGVGYAYLHMRDMDLDYKQRGIGVSVMWRFGEQQFWSFVNKGDGVSISNFAHGPSLQLLFPKYEAHHAILDYSWIGVNVLFWSDGAALDSGLTFYQFSAGATF